MRTQHFFEKWAQLLAKKDFRHSLLSGIILWIAGYALYSFIIIPHVDSVYGITVEDILLKILPLMDLNIIYLYGMVLLMVIFAGYLVFFKPELVPFSIKLMALVFITRSLFIGLTHLGPPQGFFLSQLTMLNYWPLSHMLHSNDLFFSGHVAYPFAAALVVYKKKYLFYFFIAGSIIMLFTVLLMRIHYSIDVFAAYFIVYTLYHINIKLLSKKDAMLISKI